jgi:hypothetical protein
LTSNFYAILSLPPYQVEEQEQPNTNVKKGKGCIESRFPPDHPNDNKIALQWKRRLANCWMSRANCNALKVSVKTTYHLTPALLAAIKSDDSIAHMQTYNNDSKALQRGVLDRSIPLAAANSGATSSLGTKRDSKHFISTGKLSNKIFQMPKEATESGHLLGAPQLPLE